MMPDNFLDDEVQELLGEIRVQIGGFRQLAKAFDLVFFARRIGRRQIVFGLQHADLFGAAEAFGQHVHESGVDIVDRLAIARELGFDGWINHGASDPFTSSSASRAIPGNHRRGPAAWRRRGQANHPTDRRDRACPHPAFQAPPLRPASAGPRAAGDRYSRDRACRHPCRRQAPSCRQGRSSSASSCRLCPCRPSSSSCRPSGGASSEAC
ncbi:hypothetical protein RHECNPAF_4460062 [Rhizobium etli CNPAF512]|nr:hypothetical protein RHECNPAF_4460062 [Rhizobium etli CNPAF512]